MYFHVSNVLFVPWFCSIMNIFGVLKYKKMGEDFVRNSGIPFTIIRLFVLLLIHAYLSDGQTWKVLFGIEASEVFSRYFSLFYIRAGRLTDGPYTSYDLNTLLKATAGERRAVLVRQGIYFLSKYNKWCSHLRRFINECFHADNQVLDQVIDTQLKQLRVYWFLFFFPSFFPEVSINYVLHSLV